MDMVLAALKAAGEETRLRILCLLCQGELTVTELTQILMQSQPRVSRHLRLLCDAGLLQRFREGAWVFYRLADGAQTGRLCQTIVTMIDPAQSEIERDRYRLADVRTRRAAEADAYFSRHAKEWNDIRALYVPEERVEQTLMAWAAGARTILDVGTGTGRILELLAPRARQAMGVDVNPDMLAMARARLSDEAYGHCHIRQGDMYDLPVADASQDLVVFHQVLHFADDPARAIREAARTLAPGGACLLVDFAPHAYEALREDHAHRRLGFADTEITTWADAAGLSVARTQALRGGELTVMVWQLTRPALQTDQAA